MKKITFLLTFLLFTFFYFDSASQKLETFNSLEINNNLLSFILPQNISSNKLSQIEDTSLLVNEDNYKEETFTSLGAGDIAFSSFNTDGDDAFSFVLLTDISGTTTIHFTDNGFSDVSNTLFGTEGTITWTYTGSLSAGTEVAILEPKNSNTTGTSEVGGVETGITSETGSFSMSSSGDSLIAYSGTVGVPTTYISAIFVGVSGFTSNPVTTITSSIPTGLSIVSETAMQTNSTDDNFIFDCTAGDITTLPTLRTSLYTIGNFISNSSSQVNAPGCAYLTIVTDTTPPVFENSTPNSSSITQTGFTLETDIDEAGTIYYVILADGAAAPTSEEVKAGTGSGGSSIIASDNATVSSGGFTNNFNVTGLTVATDYDVYVMAEDDEGTPNLQVLPTKIDITTAALIELTITGLSGNNKVFDGATNATVSGTASLSGIVGTDDVSLGGSPVFTFASSSIGTGITITTTGYTISGTDVANYTLTQPTLSADIVAPTLGPGDIGFSSFNTDGNDEFSFVLLADISGTTTIHFTDDGFNSGTGALLGGEGTISWTYTGSLPAGTEVSILLPKDANTIGTSTVGGVETGTTSETGSFSMSSSGDSIIAYRGTVGSPSTYIAAIFIGGTGFTDGTTTITSAIPTGLSLGAFTAMQNGGTSDNYQFDCTMGNITTISDLRESLFTISNFITTTTTVNYPAPGCNYLVPVPLALTITGLTGNNKIYEGTTTASATGTPSLSGVEVGDDVTLGGSPVFTFASANVGTGITITTTGYTLGGADAGKYALEQPILYADITTAGLTISGLTGDDKVYDGTNNAIVSGTASLNGVLGADDVTLGGSPVFTFASANVGPGITINSSGFTISGTDAANYTLMQPTLSADITATSLTISGLTGDNKAYDGTNNATASGTASLNGVLGADNVTLGGSPVFTFANANVGTGITINSSGFTISGTDAANYTLTQPTLSADITTAGLTISGLTGDDKVYDGTNNATTSGTASLNGVLGADDVTLGGSPVFTFASANVGTGITINSSGFTISGADAANYTLTQPTLSADITATSLTISGLTGDNKVFDGTTTATASGTATLNGVIGADDVSLGGSPVFTFADPNVGTGIAITSSGFTISGADAANYTLTQPTLYADITTASLTVSGLTGDNKAYDGTNNATTSGTASLNGVLGADDVTLGGSPVFTFASANVGTGIAITSSGFTISGTDAANYTLTQPTLSADITATSLTISGLTGDDKVYDGTTTATASGTASLNGVLGADDVTLGGSPVFIFASANVGTGINIFSSGFTISGADAANYTLAQPSLFADILAGQTLTVDNISIIDVTCSGGSDGMVTIDISGGTAPYSYQWSTGDITSDNFLDNLPAGDYSVTIVDALNNSIIQEFTILDGAVIEATVTEDPTVYYGYTPASYAWIGVEDVSGGTAPYTYQWNTGQTTQRIHVCPTETTTYTVIITDANGCSVTKNITVNVVDVRCGHHGHHHKVKICHKGKTICVSKWAVRAHLAHGDTLGGCESEADNVRITNLKVYPNPFKHNVFVKFTSNASADIELSVFNHRGKRVFNKSLTIEEGKTKTKLNLSRLRRGFYYLKVVINGEVKKTRHLIKY